MRVGGPTQFSYYNKAIKAQLPFKGNEENESQPSEDNKSNKGLMIFLGLALAAVLAYAFRKKLGFSKEVTKTAEETTKSVEQTAENITSSGNQKDSIIDKARYFWYGKVWPLKDKAVQFYENKKFERIANHEARKIEKETKRLAREAAKAQAASTPAILDLI